MQIYFVIFVFIPFFKNKKGQIKHFANNKHTLFGYIMKTKHKTKKINLLTAEIDYGIIDVIKWLHKFENVITLFSCEGERNEKIETVHCKNQIPHIQVETPYVIFLCFDKIELIQICEKLKTFAEIHVDFFEGSLRYYIKFNSKELLDEFKFIIKKEKIK